MMIHPSKKQYVMDYIDMNWKLGNYHSLFSIYQNMHQFIGLSKEINKILVHLDVYSICMMIDSLGIYESFFILS